MGDTGVVYVIDDDPSVRNAVSMLLEVAGYEVATCASAEEFLEKDLTNISGCLVLDVRMAGLSGLDLQSSLSNRDVQLPIVFMTGHGDIPTSVRAMKAGAVEFLTKPFRDEELVKAVSQALELNQKASAERAQVAAIQERYQKLTPRERQVLELVVQGLLNKQIALKLSASEGTIKIHRSHVMLKMQAESVADLVRMADKLSLSNQSKV
jgi:FixJ family two-component response regulator